MRNPNAPATAALATQIRSWLQRPEGVRNRWLGKTSVAAAWLGLLLGTFSPPHGTGFTVCWLKTSTGIPCPGCGLTRSLSCGLRGMFLESWHYHPMGLLILALFVGIAVASLLPRPTHEKLLSYAETHALAFNVIYVLFVATFITFGVARAVFQK